jgi:hypothetical protein
LENPTLFQTIGSTCFVLSVLHTFATKFFARIARRYPHDSMRHNFFEFLSEVEVVFGFWAFVMLCVFSMVTSMDEAVKYLEGISFIEPAFVFVIMVMASTKPIIDGTSLLLRHATALGPTTLGGPIRYGLCLFVGPILGSFITEPAAMTVSAVVLTQFVFLQSTSLKLKYSTLATLLVNVSIGGTLTHFAAPPVVMVAHVWGWDLQYMMSHFGWRAAVAVFVNTAICLAYNFRELVSLPDRQTQSTMVKWPIVAIHVVFMAAVIRFHHSMAFFVPLFLIFVGWHQVSFRFQYALKLKESLLVGFFLGGLVILGQLQSWWISPLIETLNALQLFVSTTFLTAITDNAALTYLGSLVQGISEEKKYALVAGAVTGGGLTVIANAPNPIGIGLVKDSFDEGTISPLALFGYALVPTFVAGLFFYVIGN